MPLMGMLVLLVLFCGALMYGMYRILGKQAAQAADRFSTMNEEFERKKAELKKLTQETEANAQRMIAAAQVECQKLKAQTYEDLEQTRLKSIQETRQEAERIVGDAMKARDAMRLELMQEIQTRTIDAACELVREMFPVALREEVHQFWINELIAQGLAALDQFSSREEIKSVEVLSAFPLSTEHREKILWTVQKKVHTEARLDEKVLPELIAGMRLTLGHLVLEGTLSSKLKEAALHAKNQHA